VDYPPVPAGWGQERAFVVGAGRLGFDFAFAVEICSCAVALGSGPRWGVFGVARTGLRACLRILLGRADRVENSPRWIARGWVSFL